MTVKCNPTEDNALLVYRGSLITNPVCKAEPTEWNAFPFVHNYIQEVDG